MNITVKEAPFKELNETIRGILETEDKVVLEEVYGQRYIGCVLKTGKTIQVYGTPGNDMCAYMCGGTVEVFGSCQEAAGNTMDGGTIIIHGNAGDALGYAMRDGNIYVQGDVACRGGIHMKEFNEKKPTIVVGGTAGDFFGEYMAGGTIILLGLTREDNETIAGKHTLTGMHGGRMFIRGEIPAEHLSDQVKCAELDDTDIRDLQMHIERYCKYFGADINEILDEEFYKYVPESNRPYANMYTAY